MELLRHWRHPEDSNDQKQPIEKFLCERILAGVLTHTEQADEMPAKLSIVSFSTGSTFSLSVENRGSFLNISYGRLMVPVQALICFTKFC